MEANTKSQANIRPNEDRHNNQPLSSNVSLASEQKSILTPVSASDFSSILSMQKAADLTKEQL